MGYIMYIYNDICRGPTNLKPITAVYLSEECDRPGVNVCPINKVIIGDTGSSGWYTIFGQAGISKISTAVIDTKGSTHE
jgi:hypothetical protein